MTPEREAEARRLLAEADFPRGMDYTGGVVWYLDGQQIDDEGNYEMWQIKIADTDEVYAAFFAAAPALLTEALDTLAQQREELARLRAAAASAYLLVSDTEDMLQRLVVKKQETPDE